jgi:hypothetical protein
MEEVELKEVSGGGGSGEGDIPATKKKKGEQEVTKRVLKPNFVDRLYASDRIVKFDNEGRMAFGEVSINMQTKEAKISWADGINDILPQIGDGVAVEGVSWSFIMILELVFIITFLDFWDNGP